MHYVKRIVIYRYISLIIYIAIYVVIYIAMCIAHILLCVWLIYCDILLFMLLIYYYI